MEKIDSDDYELLYMVYQMDEFSLQSLVEKYTTVAQDEVFYYLDMSPFEPKGQELVQESLRILYNTIYSFRTDKDTTFYTYYRHCLHNMMRNYCRALYTYEGQCERTMLSLDTCCVEDKVMLIDVIPNRDPTLEGAYSIFKESVRVHLNTLANFHTPFEMWILLMRLRGMSYLEISEELHTSERNIAYILRKMRND